MHNPWILALLALLAMVVGFFIGAAWILVKVAEHKARIMGNDANRENAQRAREAAAAAARDAAVTNQIVNSTLQRIETTIKRIEEVLIEIRNKMFK